MPSLTPSRKRGSNGQRTKRERPAKITLLGYRYPLGWEGELDPVGLEFWPTVKASSCWDNQYDSDAHFVCYYVVGEKAIPRLNLEAKEPLENAGMRLRFNVAALDVDHVPHSVEPSEEWRLDQEQKVFGSPWGDKVAFYHTPGGYRLVCKLGPSINADRFEEFLADWRYACSAIGIEPDEMRWNGMYRMPAIRREGRDIRYRSFRTNEAEFEALEPLTPLELKKHVAAIQASENDPRLRRKLPRSRSVSEDTPITASTPADKIWEVVADSKLPFALPKVAEEGNRHDTLFRYACSLRAKGMGRTDILKLLIKEDLQRSDPPIQYEDTGMTELERIAGRASKYPVKRTIPEQESAAIRKAVQDDAGEDGKPTKFEEPVPETDKGGNARKKRSNKKVVEDEEDTEEEDTEEEDTEEEDTEADDTPSPFTGSHGSLLRKSQEVPMFTHKSEVEFARWCINEIMEDERLLAYDQGTLRRYNEYIGVWEELPDNEVHKLVATLDRAMIYRGKDKDGKPKVELLAVSDRMTDSIASLVCKLRTVSGAFANAPPGIVFRNGFVKLTLKGPKLVPFSPSHYATTRVDCDFDPKAATPMFDKFLQDTLIGPDTDAKIQLQWEFIGCSVAGVATRMQKALLLTGGGANGKSTLLNIWIGIMPPNTVTSIPPQEIHNEYRLAHLKRSLLNAVNEAPSSNIARSAALKAVITGDRVNARHIRQDVFEYYPKAAHAFACNELPEYDDSSEGFSRRWIIQTFAREFEAEEQVRDLDKKILRKERDAILCRALVHACNAIARGRYEEPMSSELERNKWRRENDPVLTFVSEECVEVEKNGYTPQALYSAYKVWSDTNRLETRGSMKFYRALTQLKIRATVVKGQKRYKLAPKSDY